MNDDGRPWLAAALARHPLAGLDEALGAARLPRFQRDAAVRLLHLLARWGGAVLADDVGLGKTHVAMAVARSRPSFRPCLVLSPAAVRPRWEREIAGEPGFETASYARLSRSRVGAPQGGFGLIVCDEAQRLRNPATRRYRELSLLAPGATMLLLTASPIQNRARDLAALLHLFWPSALEADRDIDRLRAVLSCVLVRRTRWTINRVYAPEQRRIAGLASTPSRRRRVIPVEPTPELDELARQLPAISRAIAPDVTADEASALLSLTLARRLESSPAAFCTTLRRCRNYLTRAAEAGLRGERLSRRRFRLLFGPDPEGQVAQMLLPFFFDGHQPPDVDWLAGLPLLEAVLERWEGDGHVDPKLEALERLRRREPARSVVMTCFEDTARRLYHKLRGERWLLTGRGARSTRWGLVDREMVLRAFGPVVGSGPPSDDANACLVATDVLAEGVELQGAARLVHYDRPWNPMAMEQRIGRLDRLGARVRRVDEVVLPLGGALAEAVDVESVLTRKRALAWSVLAESPRCQEPIPAGPEAAEAGAGIDRDGLLMACLARVEGSELGEPRLLGAPDAQPMAEGWLVALANSDWLDLYWADDAEVGLAPSPLLARLARGEARRVATCPLPDTVAVAVRERARADALDRWLLLSEPGATTRATSGRARLAAGLSRRARGAHRRGDGPALEAIAQEVDRARSVGAALSLPGAGGPALGLPSREPVPASPPGRPEIIASLRLAWPSSEASRR